MKRTYLVLNFKEPYILCAAVPASIWIQVS